MSRSPSPPAAPQTEAPSSVQKACRILRALSDGRNRRLTDIAQSAGLDKATALRLLEVLTREGLVVRDRQTKHYTLGPEAFILGAAAVAHANLRAIARPSLIRLANQFGDVAILSIASGIESICIDVEFGTFPIRANYLEVGVRRPLGVGSGSLALLAWMSDAEIEAIMPLLAARLERYPRLDRAWIERQIEQARRDGYAVVLDMVVDRMGGIGVPILGQDKHPIASLSIAALSDRIEARREALALALKREALACQGLWMRQPASSPTPSDPTCSDPTTPPARSDATR